MKEKFLALLGKMPFIGRRSKKGLILSAVALAEVLAILTISTYSWIETISSIEIMTVGNSRIEKRLNTTAEIGTGSATYNNKSVDLAKFFRESGGAHYAAASSANGTDFYFPIADSEYDSDAVSPTQAPLTGKYREGTFNDKNVNYTSFSFKLRAADQDIKFAFGAVPVIKIGNSVVNDNLVRVSFSVDGVSVGLFSMQHSVENVVSTANGDKTATTIKAFSDYVAGVGSIFTIPEYDSSDDDTEKTVTVNIWVQDPERTYATAYSGQAITIQSFSLVTGGKYVSFKDFTTKQNAASDSASESIGWKWVEKDNAKMFVYVGGSCYPMTLQSDNMTWKALLPDSTFSLSGSTDVYFQRCNSTTGESDVTASPASNNKCLNYWQTTISAISATDAAPAYKAYGSSNNKLGYGTWDELVEIRLESSADASSVLAPPASGYNATKVTASFTSTASIVSEMNYNKIGYGANENASWRCYMPAADASASINFAVNGGETVTASDRETAETISTYVITQPNYGYWKPGVTVTLGYTGNTEGYGYIGFNEFGNNTSRYFLGSSGNTSKTYTVTAGITLNLNTIDYDNGSNIFTKVAWYTDAAGTEQSAEAITTPAAGSETTPTYYAQFKAQSTITAHARLVGETSDSNTGGTIKINNAASFSVSSSLTVDNNTSITLHASAKPKYSFVGWFEDGNTDPVSTDADYTFSNTSQHKDYYARFKVADKTIYVGVISYITQRDNIKVKYKLSGSETETAASISRLGTETFIYRPIGATNWSTNQTFDLYTATIPATAATAKLYNGNTAQGEDMNIESYNAMMYYNYSTDKVDYFELPTRTLYVGIIEHQHSSNNSNFYVHFWGSSTTNNECGDVYLSSTASTTEYYYKPPSTWGSKQKFYIYEVQVPANITNVKMHDGTRWADADLTIFDQTSNANCVLWYEYDSTYYNKAVQYTPS